MERQGEPSAFAEPLRPIAQRGRRLVAEETRHDRRPVRGVAQRLDDLPCVGKIVGVTQPARAVALPSCASS